MSVVRTPESDPSLKQNEIQDYIQKLEGLDQVTAQKIGSELASAEPLAQTVIIIPVAAHQESTRIEHALGEYARQSTSLPFSVVLGLNCPVKEQESQEVSASLEAVERAKTKYPNLDVRTTFNTYRKPTIGQIRRDLWNGVAIAVSQNLSGDEAGNKTIGINHDIDLACLNPLYIRNVQSYYFGSTNTEDSLSTLAITGTQTYHAPSQAHPNTSKAVSWFDYISRACESAFEAGTVIPFVTYARQKGFDSTRTEREVVGILNGKQINIIRGTLNATSPRRFIHNIDEQAFDVWAEGTFSSTDTCREGDLLVPDIARGRMHDIVRGTFLYTPDNIILAHAKKVGSYMARLQKTNPDLFEGVSADDSFFLSQVHNRLERVKTVSDRVLTRVVGKPSFANKFNHSLTSERVEELARPYFNIITSSDPNLPAKQLLIK